MKRKAEFGDWGGMADLHFKSVRPNPGEISRVLSERNLNQLGLRDFNSDYQTPMKQTNVNVMTSTPFANHTPRRPTASFESERSNVMGTDADVELRRIVDNFVSIYEQLDKCEGIDVKPNYSYTELAYLAMLRSPNFCLPITEIYRYIQSRFLFFKNSTRKHWKNAVRHSLAKTMCFTKIPIGRGTSNSENLSRSTYLWCILPNSIGNFARGDYRPNVDKESGTNTLRWGYMRVNAGQFWDQVGNYIANRMANFRKYLHDTPSPGIIFEEQVCRVPGLNLQPQRRAHGMTVGQPDIPSAAVDDRYFMTRDYGVQEGFQSPFDMPRAFQGVGRNPQVALPAKGYLSDLPIREYVNAPLLETTNNLYHSRNHRTENDSSTNYQTRDDFETPLFATPSSCKRLVTPYVIATPNPDNLTPPTMFNPPIGGGLMTPFKPIPSIPGDFTPPPAVTRFHRSSPTQTNFDKNDSGFESCSSTPEAEQRACPMSGQPIKQYTEKFSVSSCDLFDEGIQLDFSHLNQSGFSEPNFSDFCDNLLNPTEGLLESPDYSKNKSFNLKKRDTTSPTFMNKENIPTWLNELSSNENPFSFRRVTPQKEASDQSDLDLIVSSSFSDGQSLFGNSAEPAYPWTFQKLSF